MFTKRMMEQALRPIDTTASRRQFLKGSAATAGALVVAPRISKRHPLDEIRTSRGGGCTMSEDHR